MPVKREWCNISVLTDFSYETGVKTPGGLWDKRENARSLLSLSHF
ncbi:hypothetical protein [Microcoleus vaginatus]